MRCCCGCPGSTCSECSGTPDFGLYASTSGITVDPSGTCYGASGGAPTTRLLYTSSQDLTGCIQQNQTSFTCEYTATPSPLITDLLTTGQVGSFGTCPVPNLQGNSATRVSLKLSGGVYTLTIYADAGATGVALLFKGTLTVSSPKCRITSALTFSNSITPGLVYSWTTLGTTFTAFAFASGGTASVIFRKSCCP